MRVGSADEGSDEAGIAHLHEHMLFKGTARRGPGDIARTVEACGGEINAWTSFDQTVYHVVLASRFFAEGIDVLADAVTSAAFDPDELNREIEVVCEEIKRSMDSPTRKLSRELFASAFSRHPYGKPVIGTEESVRSFRREGILRFYRRWYTPENAVVIVVGDVREAEAVQLAQKLFAWPPGPFEAAPARPAEPHRELPLARLRREPLKEGYLSIAWPSPPLVHEDVAALDAAERCIDPSAAVLAALLPERDAPVEGELLELLQEAARLRPPRAPSSSAAPEKRAPVRFAEHPRTGPLLREELPGGGVLLIK